MSDYFVNPYTFVELRDKKSLCEDAPDEKELTGKISCSLITKTQIAVPDLPDGQDEHGIDKAPFFRVGGKAVIPGSGIRGVTRNVYEALTNSCMHINDKDDDFFSSRQNKQAPGLIACEADGFVLYEAQRVRITLGLSLSETDEIKCNMELHKKKIREQEKQLSGFEIGDAIYFPAGALKTGKTSTGSVTDKSGDNLEQGYYMKADSMITGKEDRNNITHNNPGIFVREKNRLAVLDSRTMNLLELNIKAYEPKTSKDRNQQYSECYKKMKSGKTMLPVWYFRDGDKFYLAPSQMSRSYFFNKPRDMLKKMGYTACTVRSSRCEACALFGMVGLGKEGEAASSRVRFGDAVCESKDCFDKFYVLPILGNPRLSSFEYYLINKEHIYDLTRRNYYHPIDPDREDTVLSGRKFYWHHNGKEINKDDANSLKAAKKARYEGKDNFSSKGSCFELVRKGQTFTFNIYLDGVTEAQLKKLLFALNFGDNTPGSELCHKIGHGKPVGLGSVKIVVDEVKLREFDGVKYSVSEDVKEKYFAEAAGLFNAQDTEQVLRVVNMNAIPDSSLIMYPVVPIDPNKRKDGDDAAFKWFAANRDSLTTNPGTIAFRRRLPHIMADDQKLPKDIRNEREQQSFGQLRGRTEYTASEKPAEQIRDDTDDSVLKNFGGGSIQMKKKTEKVNKKDRKKNKNKKF